MPTVPTYDRSNVAERGIQGGFSISAPEGAFGEGFQALQKQSDALVDSTQKIVLEQKERADQLVAEEAAVKTQVFKNDLYWNPQSGAMLRRGRDAFNILDEFSEKYNKYTQGLEDNLQNDNQKALYRKYRARYAGELNSTLNKHIAAEYANFEKKFLDDSMQASIQDAVFNFSDPGKIDGSIKELQTRLYQYADRNGIDKNDPQFKLLESQKVGELHAGVITRMLSNDLDLEAEEYYKARKGEIPPSLSEGIEKRVAEGSLRIKSQRAVDDILARNLPYQKAIEEIQGIDDVKMRDEVSKRYKDAREFQASEKRRDEENNQRNVVGILDATKGAAVLTEELLSGLSPEGRKSAYAYKKFLLGGGGVEKNGPEFYRLMIMQADDPSSFKKENLQLYHGKVTEEELADLIKIQNKDKGSRAIADTFATEMSIFNDSLRVLGLDPSPKPGTEEAKKVQRLRTEVARQQNAFQELHGRKANIEEFQKINDGVTKKVIVDPGYFWGIGEVSKLPYEIYESIPASELIYYENALREAGIPVTENAVIELYLKEQDADSTR